MSDRPTAEPSERLVSYNRLVLFGLESNLYPHGMVDNLYNKAGRAPGLATNALQKAIQFREDLFAIFSAVVEHRAIPGNPLAKLTFLLQEAMAHGRLAHNGRRFVWEWVDMNFYLESVVWPVARAAADLLLSDEMPTCACAPPTNAPGCSSTDQEPAPPLVRHENLRQPVKATAL